MDAKTLFNFPAYMARLTAENRLAAAGGYHPCTCSGLQGLEELLGGLQRHAAFVCTSDVCDESTDQHGGGWMRRRTFTVFIVKRYRAGDAASCAAALTECRELYRQFQSRFIFDGEGAANEMIYLRTAQMRSSELGADYLPAATGLYFMLAIDEPTDLCYQPADWLAPAPGAE